MLRYYLLSYLSSSYLCINYADSQFYIYLKYYRSYVHINDHLSNTTGLVSSLSVDKLN